MRPLVGRMITPLLAAYFLRAKGIQPHASGKAMDWYLAMLKWSLRTDKAEAHRARNPGFLGAVSSIFRDHRYAMVAAGLGAFVLQIVMFMTLSMQFQPPLNLDFSNVRVALPPIVEADNPMDVA